MDQPAPRLHNPLTREQAQAGLGTGNQQAQIEMRELIDYLFDKTNDDARVLELTATAAIGENVAVVELNHADTIIAATLASPRNRLLLIKDTSATGTAAHTVTVSGGSFNGTATIATLNARDEALLVYFDSAGRGSVLVNLNSVGLS